MAKIMFTPDHRAELHRLRLQLIAELDRAMAAIDGDVPGHSLEGEALARLEAAEKTIAAIRKRIKEIQGAE
jgi:hypothetical protein